MSDSMAKRKTRNRKPASRKGQAVMEYLITYGVALFVILVVLGILFAVVLPMLKTPTTCKFTDQTFSCDQKAHSLVADKTSNAVSILFQLDNTGSTPVVIKNVLCTTASTGNVKTADFKGAFNPVTLGSGQSMTFGGTGATKPQIKCNTESGTPVVLTPNSNFRGTLAIEYSNAEEVPGTPSRIAVATVTGPVLAGS